MQSEVCDDDLTFEGQKRIHASVVLRCVKEGHILETACGKRYIASNKRTSKSTQMVIPQQQTPHAELDLPPPYFEEEA
jgi:hypothetical protein